MLYEAGQLAKGGIRSYADGVNALTCTLYYPNKYPAGAVSQVDVMFNSNTKQTDHQVWIWCHIAAFKSVWDVLCGAFPGKTPEVGCHVCVKQAVHSAYWIYHTQIFLV